MHRVCVCVCGHAGICIRACVVISCLGFIEQLWSIDLLTLEALFLHNLLIVFLSFWDAINTHARPFDGASTGGSDDKESAYNAQDPSLIPESGRFPGEGNDNPLQYSCLGNSTDKGVWWAIVHGVAKSWIRLSDYHVHMHRPLCTGLLLTKTIAISLFFLHFRLCCFYCSVLRLTNFS